MKWLVLSVFLFGCGNKDGAGDDEGPAPGAGSQDENIDVTGSYNAQIAAATGCDEESFWLEDWSKGPMKISGDNAALTFDFLEGMEFGGAIDNSRNYSFAGEIEFTVEADGDTGTTTRMARIEVQNSGTFTRNGNCWEMDGDFTLLVDEDNNGLDFDNCTLAGPVKATQIQGGSCNGLQ